MTRSLSTITLLVLLTVCLAPTASGAVLYDEEIDDYIFTGGSYTITASSFLYGTRSLNSITFADIGTVTDLSYIVVDIKPYEATSYFKEGSHSLTYTFDNLPDKSYPLTATVTYDHNLLGDITDIRVSLFFPEWEIRDLTGKQRITFSNSIYNCTAYAPNTPAASETAYIGDGSFPRHTFTISCGQWTKNHITLEENRGNLIVNLQRVYGNQHFPSDLEVWGSDNLLFSNSGSDNQTQYFIKTMVNNVTLKTLSQVRVYPIAGLEDAPATIFIRAADAESSALIPGARVIIQDTSTDPVTELVNETLATGTGTFNLPQSSSLKYRATATSDNRTILSPILFGLGEEGATIVLWMAPDTAPPDPIVENKSMLYGYILTQGSQQPIPGATVTLNGVGDTTTSSTGFYQFNNIAPNTYTITATASGHDPLTESVTTDANTATQHNLALTGHYLLTVTVKDADTLANIQNATIALSDGQESTANPATFNGDYGPYTISAAAGGYYPVTQSAYLDKPGITTATILLTAHPEQTPAPEYPNYPPHNVKFTIQTLLGTPIPGVTVTAQGIQQTPSTNIIERLLGINMTSTPINSEAMTGTTDTNGEINFMMVEAVKYRISLYKPDSVDQTLEIYPKEDTYPIIISTAGGPLLPDAGDPLRSILVNVTTSTEGDTGHIHVDYNDTTHKTTGLSIQVTQQNTTNTSAPEDVIASHTVADDANVTHTFDLSVYKGQSFFVRLEAEHPDFGTVHRDYAVAFKGVRVPLGPLPDGLYIYVAGFGLMLLGGIFGATSATRGVVVIAFAGWLFYAFGWLDDLGLSAPIALGLVSTIAVISVTVTRYREEGYQ